MRAIILAALIAAPAGAAAADEVPHRAPGLWESVSTSDDGVTKARQCVGEDTDRLAKQAVGGQNSCSKNVVTRTADGYATETLCKVGAVTAEGKGAITGDFQTTVRIETVTVLTGLPDQSTPLTRKTVIENRRIGDCQPGQKPGDIILEDGTVAPTPGTPAKPQ
ncbi:DUF3617 domain-containing protein [Methylopila henanensis]|uniref:DUF3617 domain-containing protein n=1 Tax=Methylopila henanensis TaxID=873516 RepID=A0ABW4K824_9HYPH